MADDTSDWLWLFRPGTSPTILRMFYIVSVGLFITLVGMLGLGMVYDDDDLLVHAFIFILLAFGLVASVSWVLSLVPQKESQE